MKKHIEKAWMIRLVIEHIYGLTLAIVLTIDGKEFDFSQDKLDYQGLRENTLNNLKYVFNKLKERRVSIP